MKPIQQWTTSEIIDFLKHVDKKTWGKVAAGVAIFAVLYMIFIHPAWFKRMEVRRQMKALEGQIETVETLKIRKPELMRMKKEYKDFVEGVKSRLYRPGEAALLLGEISRIANESQVKIIASRPEDPKEKFPEPFSAQYRAHLYEFAVEGGYHQLGNFIGQIESSPKILRIQLFNIRPQEETPGNHIADVSLSAVSLKRGGE